jgi:hypothetical protein
MVGFGFQPGVDTNLLTIRREHLYEDSMREFASMQRRGTLKKRMQVSVL